MELLVNKVRIHNVSTLMDIARILKKCGDDMYAKYNLTHWKNSYFKTLLIVFYTALKNDVYVCVNKNEGATVATFQTRRLKDTVCFSKLAVMPNSSGKGIGSFCLEQIEEMTKKEGIYTLKCEVYDKSIHARNFYISRGYKEVGNVNTLKYNELILEKKLKKESV